jgi:hypothetical protein
MIMAADLAIKEPCRVATTANITLSGLQTIDGVALAAGDRVLVRAQASAVSNGIYVAASGGWSRATDFDDAGEVAGGTQAFVTSGTLFADSRWRVAGNGPVTVASGAIDFDPEFIQTGTGAAPRQLQSKVREFVSVRDYGAAGDGTTDDSAAIQAAVDANKGETIVLPSGYTFLAAGTLLAGSTYDGTIIVVEGTYKLKASGGSTNHSADFFGGIILEDCEDVTVDVPGMFDGNRAAQTQWQQHHCLALLGARHIRIPQFNAKEVRGDGIFITTETNVAPMSTNSANIDIGPVCVRNGDDDGRNALSIVSCENIHLAGGISVKVGGIIDDPERGPERMPGGLDIEPDGAWHLVRNVVSGPWIVETIGTSGIGIIGLPITNDANRDWNVQNVSIAPSLVTHTGSSVGGPILKRCTRAAVDVTVIRSVADGAVSIDYADFCSVRAQVEGASYAVVVGYEDSVRDSEIHVAVENYTASGLQVIGAERCRFTGYVRGATSGSPRYGIQASITSQRSPVSQTDVVYSVDVPCNANNAFAFQTSLYMEFTNVVIADCAFHGYADYATQFGFGTFIPTRNVQGRNFATAIPTTGYWMLGDYVQKVNPSIASGKVLLGWSRLTTGGSHSAGTDWTPVYATTS